MLFSYFKNITFAQPWFFTLFILLPILIIWYAIKNKKQQSVMMVSSIAVPNLASFKTTFRHLPFVLRLLTLACIIVALAKPQTQNQLQQADGEGIDIALCIDVSGSMTAQDLKPNRLEAAKAVAADFVSKRQTDNIGVVIFAGESFTLCPITTNYPTVLAAIESIHNGLLIDGTSIGSGLGTSVERLKGSKVKSKVVVLITDGVDGGGYIIDPRYAKEIAKAFGVKVYTIGVGTDGYVTQPVQNENGDIVYKNVKVNIDEKLLTEIATETGGKYYRAKDNDGLINIYNEINQLEKSKVEITTITKYTDQFFVFVFVAIVLLIVEVFLRFTTFKKFP